MYPTVSTQQKTASEWTAKVLSNHLAAGNYSQNSANKKWQLTFPLMHQHHTPTKQSHRQNIPTPFASKSLSRAHPARVTPVSVRLRPRKTSRTSRCGMPRAHEISIARPSLSYFAYLSRGGASRDRRLRGPDFFAFPRIPVYMPRHVWARLSAAAPRVTRTHALELEGATRRFFSLLFFTNGLDMHKRCGLFVRSGCIGNRWFIGRAEAAERLFVAAGRMLARSEAWNLCKRLGHYVRQVGRLFFVKL